MNIEATLALISGKPVTLHQCAEIAKDHGFDSMTFDLVGPTGRLRCKWLDAYFGFFTAEGHEGFMSESQFTFVHDVHCENLSASGIEGEAGDAEERLHPEGESPAPKADAQ